MEKLKESITTEGSDNITNLLELTACSHDAMPNFYSYTRGMDVYGRVMFTYGAAAVVIIIFMYVDTVRHVINNSIPKAKTPTIIIISIYPVVAVVTFCAILVPRAYLLADTAAQVMFMCGVYQMFRLFIAYCGGERQLIEKVYDKKLNLKAPPCCCWPCCSFLPKVSVNTKRMHLLRVLIIQLPIVQGALYLVFLVFWAEKQKPYQVTTRLAYLQPTILITILIGIWAMRMITNVLKDVLDGYSLTAKFLALQLVTLSSQFYGLLTRILLDSGVLPCFSSITPFVLASLIYNYAMLMEMIILAYWARRLYKKVLPDLHLNEVELSPMNGDVEKQQDETIPEKLKITEPE